LHSVKIRRWDCFSKRVFEKGFKKIIAICGDGTINEVAKGFFTFNEDKENAAIADIYSAAANEGDYHHKNGDSDVDTIIL
jgi:hypothetical protein